MRLTENELKVNYDVIIMIEYPEEPDLNFNLLFDGPPIIQRCLSHLSHKDKVHLEASDEK